MTVRLGWFEEPPTLWRIFVVMLVIFGLAAAVAFGFWLAAG